MTHDEKLVEAVALIIFDPETPIVDWPGYARNDEKNRCRKIAAAILDLVLTHNLEEANGN